MRRLLLGSVMVVAASVSVSAAQSTVEKRTEDMGERLGTMIEKFVKQVTREFTGRNGEVVAEDTLRKKRTKKSGSSRTEDVTYEGTTTINKDEVIESNIVVKGGDLTVYGEIGGDVLVVGGTLTVKDGGRITGDARVINGDIIKEDGGVIEGYMDKTGARTAGYRESRDRFRTRSTALHANWVNELTTVDDFIFRYNRVEGLFLGFGSEKKYYWDGYRDFSGFGSFGYGFGSHRWRANLGLSRQIVLGEDQLLEFGVEGHSLTDSKDQWLISQGENTAAAMLIHEDYRDYFGRAGWGVNATYSVQRDYFIGQFKVEYLDDKYSSLENMTEWSVFGGDKVFRLNPPITDGKMRSVVTSLGISTVTKTMSGQEGWSAFGTAELSEPGFGGNFDFRQYTLDIRRYQPISRYDNFNVRLRAGTTEGVVPLQKSYELGGLSSVQVLPFKALTGNRMLLANVEYILNGDVLHDLEFWPSWIMRDINFIFIGDAGWVAAARSTARANEGFGFVQLKQFRSDLGAGISNHSGSFRVAYLWATDGSDLNRVIFRFSRPF